MTRNARVIAFWIPFAAALWTALAGAAGEGIADERSSVESRLGREGLVPHGTRTWVLEDELRVRERIAVLPSLKERILKTQRRLEEQVETNRAVWEAGQLRLEPLRKSIGLLQTDDGRLPVLRERLRHHESQLIEPGALGAVPSVRDQLIDLSTSRNEVIRNVGEILRQVPLVQRRYATLLDDPRVREALSELGEDHRISPIRSDYRADVHRVKEISLVAMTDWCPIYLQSGKVRVSALVDESHPVTFTWDSGARRARLTSSMAEAAGIVVPPDAPRVSLRSRERELRARRVTVDRIRFGDLVLRGVTVDVLEPDAEDLGALIGPRSFGDRKPRCRPEILRLSFPVGSEQ